MLNGQDRISNQTDKPKLNFKDQGNNLPTRQLPGEKERDRPYGRQKYEGKEGGGETRDNHITKDLNKEEGNMASVAH
jgi:hypothetical protein